MAQNKDLVLLIQVHRCERACAHIRTITQTHTHKHTHKHTGLPEASFLGLSVKPYIHTAGRERGRRQETREEERRGEKERKQLFSLSSSCMQHLHVNLSQMNAPFQIVSRYASATAAENVLICMNVFIHFNTAIMTCPN